MAKKRREYDLEEIKAIVELRLEEVGGRRNKLTYNSVFKLNKRLVEDEVERTDKNALDENGNSKKLKYRSYGYDFWAGSYKGEDYPGKVIIDKEKGKKDDEIFSGYIPEVRDIVAAVHDLHTKPEDLIQTIINMFKLDRGKIKRLEEERDELREKLISQKEHIQLMQKSINNLFYNSHSSRNSLSNMISINNKSNDWFVKEQMKNAFCTQKELIEILEKGEILEVYNNVTQLDEERSNRLQECDDLGL